MTDQTKADKLKSLKNIDLSHLGKAEAKEFTVLLEELEKREFQEQSTSTFMQFVKSIWSDFINGCLLYTSPSPRDISGSRMPSSA